MYIGHHIFRYKLFGLFPVKFIPTQKFKAYRYYVGDWLSQKFFVHFRNIPISLALEEIITWIVDFHRIDAKAPAELVLQDLIPSLQHTFEVASKLQSIPSLSIRYHQDWSIREEGWQVSTINPVLSLVGAPLPLPSH